MAWPRLASLRGTRAASEHSGSPGREQQPLLGASSAASPGRGASGPGAAPTSGRGRGPAHVLRPPPLPRTRVGGRVRSGEGHARRGAPPALCPGGRGAEVARARRERHRRGHPRPPRRRAYPRGRSGAPRAHPPACGIRPGDPRRRLARPGASAESRRAAGGGGAAGAGPSGRNARAGPGGSVAPPPGVGARRVRRRLGPHLRDGPSPLSPPSRAQPGSIANFHVGERGCRGSGVGCARPGQPLGRPRSARPESAGTPCTSLPRSSLIPRLKMEVLDAALLFPEHLDTCLVLTDLTPPGPVRGRSL